MVIRQEQPADYEAVYQVVKEAFANAEHTDGHEQDLVVALRKSRSFEVNDENFMAICFCENGNKLNGFIEYDKAFGI